MTPAPKQIDWQIHRRARLDSTQTELKKEALTSPEGTVLVAETQTGGLGREGRIWHSEPGGLYLSVLLKPSQSLNDLPLSLLYAVCTTLEQLAGKVLTIKWPNDLLANGAKLAGMLIDSQFTGHQPLYYLCGIGINLNQANFPAELGKSAISLAQLSSKHWHPDQILTPLLESIALAYQRLQADPQLWRRAEQPLGLRPIQIGYNTQETKTLGELLVYD
ncbi:MAG: biotin--[acetyl-CoA-carboxylase] ligase [Candidatus Sericytochromatia bacterium]